MQIKYKDPHDYGYIEVVDNSERKCWIPYENTRNAKKIDRPEDIKHLPTEVRVLVKKWEMEFKELINKNYHSDCPNKLATIYFRIHHKTYRLRASAFDMYKYIPQGSFITDDELFEGNNGNIQQDLKELGAKYSWFEDEID